MRHSAIFSGRCRIARLTSDATHYQRRLSLDARPFILGDSTGSPTIEPTLTTAAGRAVRNHPRHPGGFFMRCYNAALALSQQGARTCCE